jgi:F-type H+-transporting ATPase subunit delta
MQRSSAAARRYARALFSIARDDGAVESVRGELDAMGRLLDEAPELRRALFRPLHPVKERRAVLAGVGQRAGISASVQNFLMFLIDQRRLVDFDAIRSEFGRLADDAAGRIKAEVVSASELPEAQRERLRLAIARRTGREVDLEVAVDPGLIGGAVARIGGMVFDGSLRRQLGQLRDTLTRGH